MFQPAPPGYSIYLYFLGALLFTVLLVAGLAAVPQRFRRYLILGITFVGGLFFAVEFFWPTHPMPTPENPKGVGNFLTPYVVPFGQITPVIGAWAVGLGVFNLFHVHGKRILRGSSGWGNSLAFFVSVFAMVSVNILQATPGHENAINKNLNKILFEGGLASLDSTMFSMIAFYIVSASYRAFRVRSVEATMLLITAIVVMLGQIAIGQLLTAWLPKDGFVANFRVENVRAWIMEVANTAVVRAIAFGLGIGGLALALRIWLGLERGSYFEGQ